MVLFEHICHKISVLPLFSMKQSSLGIPCPSAFIEGVFSYPNEAMELALFLVSVMIQDPPFLAIPELT